MGFEDIIKDKLGNHESPVPPNAWANINKKKNRRRFAIIWWSSLVLLICGIMATRYFINNGKSEKLIAKNDKSIMQERNNEQLIMNNEQPIMNNEKQETNNETTTANAKPNTTNNEQQKANNQHSTSNIQQSTINETPKTKQETTNNEQQVTINKKQETNNEKQEIGNGKTRNVKGKLKTWQSGGAVSENDITVKKNEKRKKDNGKLLIDNEQPQINNEEQTLNNDKEIAIAKQQVTINKKQITNNDKQETEKNETNNSKQQTNSNEQQVTINDKQETKKEQEVATNTNLPKTTNNDKQETKKQETNNTKRQISKGNPINIDISITPLLPLQHYDANVSFIRTRNENGSITTFNSSSVKTTITPSVAVALGINKQISKKISIGTGLQYVQLKENIQVEGTEKSTSFSIINRLVNGSAGPQLIPDTIATTTEGVRNINAVNSYQLFSVPIFLQYHLLQRKRWAALPVAGIYINVASSYQNEINRNATSLLINNATTNKNSVAFDVFAAVRISKVVGKKIEMFTMPTLRWNIGQYNIKNSLINKNIHQAACSFGLTYKIK